MSDDKMPKKRGRPAGVKSMKPNRQGSFTLQKKNKFLKLVEKNGGNQSAAAAKVGISPGTITYHQKNDPAFKERLEMAKLKAMQEVEEAITKRGVEGYDEDVYYKGEVVGKKKVYSDTLLMERARALDSQRYGKRSQVDVNANVTVEHKARTKLASLLGIEIEEGEWEAVPNEGDE